MKKLFFAILAAIPAVAQAQTDLYVRGAGRLIPIALPRLCIQTEDKGPEGTIPSIIAKDLDLSGYFEILDQKSYIESPGRCGAPEATTFSDWTVLGTEGLVKGEVWVDGDDVRVRLFLLDAPKGTVVMGKEYEAEIDQVKTIAHKFANEIMKYYTGIPGVFGSKIAFSSRVGRFKELFMMDMDGTGVTQLTNERGLALSAAWNPSGTKLVYTSFRNRVPDLFILDVESKVAKALTKTPDLEVGGHFLGEDRIIASRMEGADSDIVILDLDGQVVKRLTGANRAIDVSPYPSPDGSRVAFCSNRGGGPQIYVMGIDGSNPQRISFVTSNYCTSPSWSPMGDKLAYVCRADGNFQLFISNPDGSNAVQLTSSGTNEDPEFSPDGRYLVFSTSSFGDGRSIAIIRTDGTSLKQVARSRGGDHEPTWGPMPK
jgi:TolB protein